MRKKGVLGMTLVEVLVALALVGVGGSLFGYLITSLQSTKTAREETSALAYGRNYLEGLQAKWQTLKGYQTLSIKVKVQNEAGSIIYSFPGGASSEDLSALRNITLTFTDEHDKTVSLVTQIARPTPIPTEEN
jgi:prepilin-type N-terminal cleavage/methylation domain-containing protein